MKIFEINSGNYSSTGNIMLNIAKAAREKSHIVKVAYRKSRSVSAEKDGNTILIGNSFFGLFHRVFSELTGLEGFFSVIPTLKLIKKIKNFEPDIIHFHILHGWYINLPIFFHFLKKYKKPIIWTMHDCWAFTGHCPYFDLVKCEKWKTECENCASYRNYPYSRLDNSKLMYKTKKKIFSDFSDLTIVTPSVWLSNLVKQSFLKKYPVKFINNGINLSVFNPKISDFREKNNIREDQFVILGVAFDWDERKGLDVFKKLANDLSDDFQIVLVGTNELIEKDLPENIISVRKTKNAEKLAEIYSAADLFVNPTREENYPTVNMEAIACGTPVVTFKTGGSPEILNVDTGRVVEYGNYDAMLSAIKDIYKQKPFSSQICTEFAKKFDMNNKFREYVELYEQIYNNK